MSGDVTNINIAGFGGQGVVLAGYLLGHAAILDGFNALQTQSYGSESRGGACKSGVIISKGEILDIAPLTLDVLVAMSQPALDKYQPSLTEGGVLIYDNGIVSSKVEDGQAFGIDATAIAHGIFGRDVVANVIMLGCLAGHTRVVSRDSLLKAIAEAVPPRTVDVNARALEEGFTRASGPK